MRLDQDWLIIESSFSDGILLSAAAAESVTEDFDLLVKVARGETKLRSCRMTAVDQSSVSLMEKYVVRIARISEHTRSP